MIIGGTRFVGRAIVEELLRRGHTVTVYSRGRHEAEFSGPVAHIHGDRRDYPRFQADLARLIPEAVVDVVPSVPAHRLPPTNPYASSYHLVYDLGRIRTELGYRETVSLEEGMWRTVAWLVADPPTPATWGLARYLEHEAFDYAAEDAAIATTEQSP